VKQLTTIFIAAFFLAACQGESQEQDKPVEKAPAQQETVKPAVDPSVEKPASAQDEDAHASHDGHQHDAVVQSGEPYEEVTPEFACESPVVIEFFAYQCPHCYSLEPAADAWRKKNAGRVKFISVPTHLGRQEFGSLLLVHHAADKLGVLDKAQHALFERVHKEKKLFGSPEEAADFLLAQGATDRDEALAALNDQTAMAEVIEQGFQMMTKYKVTSVPRVLVNHQYMTDISRAGGQNEVFELVDELLKKDHSCQAKS